MRKWSRSMVLALLATLVVCVLVPLGALAWSFGSRAWGVQGCREEVAAEEAKVRTDREWTQEDIPGVGAYAEVHWQVRASGSVCSLFAAPGPTDYDYQGVLRLSPADAGAFVSAYRWEPVPVTEQPVPVWPGLAAFVPADVRWQRSQEYTDSAVSGGWGAFYFDPVNGLLLFTLSDR